MARKEKEKNNLLVQITLILPAATRAARPVERGHLAKVVLRIVPYITCDTMSS
jgi:hypothetical protein